MPRFEAELSDGRIVEFESDHDPTPDEVLSSVGDNGISDQFLFTPNPFSPPNQLESEMERLRSTPPATPAMGFVEELTDRFGDLLGGAAQTVPSILKTIGVGMSRPDPLAENVPMIEPPPLGIPEQHPVYQLGERAQTELDRLFPPSEEFELPRAVVRGAGQMIPMIAGGAAAKAIGAAPATAAGVGAGIGVGMEFDDAFERSRRRGDSPDEAFAKSLGYATVAGLIENKLGAGRILRQMFPSASQAAQRLTAMGVSKKILGNFVAGGAEEGAQRFSQNWIVEEKPSTEGVLEEAAVGSLVEGAVGLPSAATTTAATKRTPDAVQPQSAEVPRDVQQPEVPQESAQQVPQPEGGAQAPKTLTPAVRSENGLIETAADHGTAQLQHARKGNIAIESERPQDFGFVDEFGNFYTRTEGVPIFERIYGKKPSDPNRLTSEDLKSAGAVRAEEAPQEAKKRTITERIKSGLNPDNITITVNKDPSVPGFGYVQVDEMHPTEGNVFSSNPAQMNELGFTMPTEKELLGLPSGTYKLTQAQQMLGSADQSQRAAAFFPRQSEMLGLGEPSLPPTVETVRQQRREEAGAPSGITPAPGEKTTPTRGVFFEGKNPRETSRMMQQRADDFLASRTDEQAIVDLARFAGGDPGVQLDNQAANFAIKDLLAKLHAQIATTKNPVFQQNAWKQIDRLAEMSRRLGAEDARSLVSRSLAYRQIDWLMPLLAWRGIVKDKWRKALGLQEGQPLDESLITPEAAKRLGLPELNGEQTAKIAALAKEARNLPQGVRRNKALEEMVREIQKVAPIPVTDLLRDTWYGSVLMRVGTMLNVLAGSYATGASFAGLAALDRAVRLHPIQAMKIIGQFLGGTIEGTLIADQIARKGAYHLLPDAEQRMVNLLTGKAGARFDNLEELLRRGNPLGILAYTRRFMAALDYIGALGTRDSQVLYGALTRGDQESLDALQKRFNREESKRAGRQARAELGPKASLAEVLVRKREILEAGVSEEIKEQSVQTARRAAQNADPRGIPGWLYKIASKMPFWLRAPSGLAFMRSAMNMVQNASDYMPGIGAVSAIRGKLGTLPENHPLRYFGMDMPLEERRMAWSAQGASLGIAAVAAAMFLGDDDDEGMEISGSWKGLTPQKKSQLMELGERPNSIRFGKKGPWISFKQMPFAPPLAMIGTMRDQERFNAKDWDAESAADKLIAAWLGGILYIKDISSLSGIAGMFDMNAWSTQENPTKLKEKANKLAAQSVGRAASGYIPSVIKEIDEFGDPTLYRPSKDEMAGWWVRNIPYARRTVGPGPALNNFGEPIQTTPPPIKSWAGFGKDNDLYQTLGRLASRGIFLPEPGRTATIVDETGERREMTEDEWYRFIKIRGPILKNEVLDNLEELKTAPPEDVIHVLRTISEAASAEARGQISQ